MRHRVSVVITTFNQAPYIRETVEAALQQMYPSREILRQGLETTHNPKVAGSNPAPDLNQRTKVATSVSRGLTCGSLPQRSLVHISPRLEPVRSQPAFRISKERMRRLSRGDSERVTERQVPSTLANEISLCIHIGHGATPSTSARRRAAADHVLLGQSPGVAVGGQR